MADGQHAQLGAIQETLFIPLAARARETRKKRPILRDPKAVHVTESIDFDLAEYGRGVGGLVTTLRTATLDVWVRDFLAANPGGTVIEIGTAARHRLAPWQWACDDPRSLERLGLAVVEMATITRPPAALRTQLPPVYRYLLPLADPVGRSIRNTLFRADRQAVR